MIFFSPLSPLYLNPANSFCFQFLRVFHTFKVVFNLPSTLPVFVYMFTVPPEFERNVTSSTVRKVAVVKSAFSLSCPVDGEPKPQVNWYKDGVQISRENLQYRYI